MWHQRGFSSWHVRSMTQIQTVRNQITLSSSVMYVQCNPSEVLPKEKVCSLSGNGLQLCPTCADARPLRTFGFGHSRLVWEVQLSPVWSCCSSERCGLSGLGVGCFVIVSGCTESVVPAARGGQLQCMFSCARSVKLVQTLLDVRPLCLISFPATDWNQATVGTGKKGSDRHRDKVFW